MPPVENKTWLGKIRGNYKCGNCNHCSNMVKTNIYRCDNKSRIQYIHLLIAIPHSLSTDLNVLVVVFILEELSVNLKKD